MAFTTGNDINILQASDTGIVGAGLGDDIYIVSPVTMTAGQEITLTDTEGINTLQLIGGLTIASSIVVSNALQLTLSNGAIINVNGADTFGFNVGGNAVTGDVGVDKTFTEFVTEDLGTTVPAEGDPASTGGEVVIGEVGASFSIDDVTVAEDGATATFTVSLSEAPGTGESVTVDYATADGTATAGSDYTAATGTLTFAEGVGTQTITVAITDDFVVEDDESFTVTLDNESGTIGGVAVVISDAEATGTIANDDATVDFTLTADDDTYMGTADYDDYIVGTSANLSADDRLMDASITDNDTFNLTATSDPAVMDVTNIENININWDGFGTPDIDLDDVSGATVTLSSTKSGYLGNANFTNVGGNNIVAGQGIVGDLTVGALDDASVTANYADAVTLTAADGEVNVTSSSAETVSITDGDEIVIDAQAATDVEIQGAGPNSAYVTFGVDSQFDMVGATSEYTVMGASAVTLQIDAGAVFETLTIDGSNAVVLDFDDASDLDGLEIINGGAIILAGDAGGAVDYEDITHTSITYEEAQTTGAHTYAAGATLVAEFNLTGNMTFQTSAANDETSGDTLNLTVQATQGGNIITQGGTGDFELVNITVDADAVASAPDVVIADIQAGTEKVIFTSASNDFTVTTMDASEVDASAVDADFNMTQTTDAEMLVVGGTADNTVVFAGIDNDSTFIGEDGDDDITLVNEDGEVAMIVNGGDNTVTADSLDTGQLTVQADDGDDTVSAAALTTGSLSLALGDGDNDITFGGTGDTLAGAIVQITTGNGDDTVEIAGDTHADDEITLSLGTGINVLDLSNGADFTAGTWVVSGLDEIAIDDADTNAVVEASLLDGQSYKITGQGTVTEHIAVESDTNGSLDFSSLDIDNTIDEAIGGLAFTANDITGDYTVVGSEGDDTFDFQTATGDNTVTGGEGFDEVTLDATDGEDTVIFDVGDLVALTLTEDVNTGTTDQLDDTDTITFGNGIDTIANFELDTDTIDLSAFSLEVGAVVVDTAGGADADGSGDGDIEVGNGEYAIIEGTLAGGVFTVGAADGNSLVLFDADTTTGVSLVGVYIDALVTADDLAL